MQKETFHTEKPKKISINTPDMPTSPSTNNEITLKSGKSSAESIQSLNFMFSPKQESSFVSSNYSFCADDTPKRVQREVPVFPLPKGPRKPSKASSFLTPTRALLDFFEVLTEYEQNEIVYYDEIYYVGENCSKKTKGFDDPEGYYIAVSGDHLEYRYEIKEALGNGTFGEVFRCFDYKRQINVAVKIIRNKPTHRKAGDLEKKILYELSIADPHDTNCIVKKWRSFEFRGHLCLVFELLSVNLYEFLIKNQHRGISLPIVRRISVQLFMAMRTVHSVGIIHCDLKPENILLKFENKSSIKVIDFGSACQEGNKVFDYIQSRYYRSPEVVLEAGYDKEIDIWSIGCILFELLTGYPLFPAENEHDLFKMLVETIGLPPDDLLAKGKRSHYYVNRDGSLRHHVDVLSRPLKALMEGFEENLIDLIEKCIKWRPQDRISAEVGLTHGWVRGQKDRINQ